VKCLVTGYTMDFYLCCCVQTGCRVHPASYPVGIISSFPKGKVAGKLSWPLTSIYCWGWWWWWLWNFTCMSLYIPHGMVLRHRSNFIFTLSNEVSYYVQAGG